jgi:zinc transport system permease protein
MLEALQYEFMQNALIAGFLASVACGIIGSYVIVKRMVFISGGVSHASFGGIGMGYFLGIEPIIGAFFFTIASALGMGLVTRRSKIPEDTAIGMLWAMGMAVGIIFVGLTPGFHPGLMGYLFGDILIVSTPDIIMILILAIVIIIVVVLLYKEFLATSFDEEFATVVGLPVERLYFLLLCLIAFTVVVLIRVVGSILVIALLTIPAAMARRFTHDLKKMMLLSILFGSFFTFGGLWVSFELDLASGATIITVSGVTFLAALFVLRLRRLLVRAG